MIETLLVLYACGAGITGAVCFVTAIRDDDLSLREKAWYPVFGALCWPIVWYVWLTGKML